VKRYFKVVAEVGSEPDDHWTSWLEYDDDQNTRQAEWTYDRWVCSIVRYYPWLGGTLADQPWWKLAEEMTTEVSREEFEQAWEKALEWYRKHEPEAFEQ
jgi:hypothetical protein